MFGLAPGRYRLSVRDERSVHDPRRLAGSHVEVVVRAHGVVGARLSMAPGGTLHVAIAHESEPTRFARVTATHTDGESLDVRSDVAGQVRLSGLRAGTWTITATDARRSWCSAPALAPVGSPAADRIVHLALDTPTSALLVRVPTAGPTSEVVVVDGVGVEHRRPLVAGAAFVTGLAPGTQTVSTSCSSVTLGLEPEALVVVEPTAQASAVVQGRVVGAGGAARYAALVAVLDEDGAELDRVRSDEHGRFEIVHRGGSLAGCTVVATTGPESLHVTRTACADIDLVTGVRLDLGDLVLPHGGPDAVWTPGTRTIRGMKLPSTRV